MLALSILPPSPSPPLPPGPGAPCGRRPLARTRPDAHRPCRAHAPLVCVLPTAHLRGRPVIAANLQALGAWLCAEGARARPPPGSTPDPARSICPPIERYLLGIVARAGQGRPGLRSCVPT